MRVPPRFPRFFVTLAIAAALPQFLAACSAQPGPAGNPSGPTRVDPFGRGINLGNALEAPREGDWGVTVRERYVAATADAGFRTVRLPVKWSAHASEAAPYTIDPEFLARVDEVVGWILDHGLQVIVNLHHYDEMATEPVAHVERWLGIWRQLAEHYRDAPDAVAFELMNEPNGVLDDALWNAMVQRALAIVREHHPTRWVVVGPTRWNGIGALPGLAWPDDDRLVVTVHYYDPFDFTHQGAEWVDPVPPVGRTWTGTRRTPTLGWQDWSWGTTRTYGEELTIAYDEGWAGFYLRAPEAETAYARLVLRTSRPLDLLVLCGAGDEGAVPVSTAAGVEAAIDLDACGGAAGVPRVVVQNGSDRPQPAFALEMLELRGPVGVLPLVVSEADAIAAAFDRVRAWAEAEGEPPVLLGEFGAYGLADIDSRARWTQAVREAAETRGFGWAYWEFGAGFGAYDLQAETWRPELLAALIGE